MYYSANFISQYISLNSLNSVHWTYISISYLYTMVEKKELYWEMWWVWCRVACILTLQSVHFVLLKYLFTVLLKNAFTFRYNICINYYFAHNSLTLIKLYYYYCFIELYQFKNTVFSTKAEMHITKWRTFSRSVIPLLSQWLWSLLVFVEYFLGMSGVYEVHTRCKYKYIVCLY